MPPALARLAPILPLICSNGFMTLAWYGHLKFRDRPLWLVILASWGIAFFEYCLAVPANRWGAAVYSAAELKAMQEWTARLYEAGYAGADWPAKYGGRDDRSAEHGIVVGEELARANVSTSALGNVPARGSG